MSIVTTATGTTSKRRRTLAAALAMTAGLGVAGVAGAGPAAAAGPYVLSYAGQNVNFPSWVWGTTTVCAKNLSSYSYGFAAVRPVTRSYPTNLTIAPGATRCTSGSWGGFPVNVANTGNTSLRVYSY